MSDIGYDYQRWKATEDGFAREKRVAEAKIRWAAVHAREELEEKAAAMEAWDIEQLEFIRPDAALQEQYAGDPAAAWGGSPEQRLFLSLARATDSGAALIALEGAATEAKRENSKISALRLRALIEGMKQNKAKAEVWNAEGTRGLEAWMLLNGDVLENDVAEAKGATKAPQSSAPASISSDEELLDTYLLLVQEARNLVAADLNGKSDPYCKVRLAREGSAGTDNVRVEHTTKVVKKDLNPKWEEVVDLDASSFTRADTLIIDIFDRDTLTKDDHIGSTRVAMDQLFRDLGEDPEKGAWFPLSLPERRSSKHTPAGEILLGIRALYV
jgi:C2 domain